MRNMTMLSLVLGVALPLAAQIAPYIPAPVKTSGFQSETVTATGKPVARVNGALLTDKDLLREMLAMFPYATQHGGKFPKAMENDIRRGALSMIEFEELVYQEAERRKITISNARLEHALQAFQAQFESKSAYLSYLKDEFDWSEGALREKIRRSILIDELLKSEVTQKASVSDAAVRAYYDKNRARFYAPETVAIQTISIAIPENATQQQLDVTRRRADESLAAAKKTKSYEEFGILAEKSSQDDWRVMMGDHQLVSQAEMPPELAKVAFALQPGQMSEVVRAEGWWCILRVNSRQPGHQLEFKDVKANLKKEMESSRVEDLRSAFHRQLRKGARVEEL